MARPESRWMPLDWGDYWRDTGHLRGAGHGAYLNLIGAYWNRGGALPNNDAALEAMSKCTSKEWRSVRADVLAFFVERDGHLHHSRVDRELERAKTVYERRREAARSTNAKRGGNRDGDRTDERQESDADSATSTERTPPPQSPQHSSDEENPPVSSPRGKRLDAGWKPSDEDRAYAKSKNLTDIEIDEEAIAFVRYWTGPDAKNAAKKDWHRTWCNRIDDVAHKIISRRPKTPMLAKTTEATAPRTTTRDEWVAYYRAFLRMGFWPLNAGPKPGEPGCSCPRDVIEFVDLDSIPANMDRRPKPTEAA